MTKLDLGKSCCIMKFRFLCWKALCLRLNSFIVQVYRAETSPLQTFSGDASFEGLNSTDGVDGGEAIMQQQFKAFQNLSKLHRENLRVGDMEVEKMRLRSLSENIATSSNFYVMEPLDISFDNKEGEALPELIGDSGAYGNNLSSKIIATIRLLGDPKDSRPK